MFYFFFFAHYSSMDIVNRMIFIFFIFSFIGWCWELSLYIFKKNKVINRGFLHGPILPIYGFGILLIWLLFKSIKLNLIIRFLLISLVCAITEYLTSYFLEKIFHKTWWDYKDCKFNLNGRICLQGILFFSIGALLALDFIIPFAMKAFNYLVEYVSYINAFLIILLIIDVCYSLKKPNTGKNISKKAK